MPSAVFVLLRGDTGLVEQRRAHDSYYPGGWLFPSGKCNPGEAPKDALVRECREELGITITQFHALALPAPLYYARQGNEEYRVWPYLIDSYDGEIAQHILDSGNVLQWQPLETLVVSPIEYVRIVATAARGAK